MGNLAAAAADDDSDLPVGVGVKNEDGDAMPLFHPPPPRDDNNDGATLPMMEERRSVVIVDVNCPSEKKAHESCLFTRDSARNKVKVKRPLFTRSGAQHRTRKSSA